MKTCTICHEPKVLDDFPVQTKSPDGRGSYCRICHREKSKQWKIENADRNRKTVERYRADPSNLEKTRAASRSWRARNKDHQRALTQQFHAANPERNLLYDAKKRAKRFDLPFSITYRDIVIPEFCPVLGLRLERGKGRLTDASPSLDKIVPELGYVPGNIAVISHRANRIKSDSVSAELRAVADWLDKQTLHPPTLPGI